MKRIIFKGVLGLYTVMVFAILGIAHIFFPDAYFQAVNYPLWDPADDAQREMVQLIGGGYVAMGIGGALIWLRPERNVDLFRVLLIGGTISVLVVAYTILIGVAPAIVWYNTVIPYAAMLTIMAFSYPWAEARTHHAAAKGH